MRHFLQNAQVTTNKMVHKKTHFFLAQFVLLQVLSHRWETQLLIRDECQKHLADGWPAMSVGEMILTIIAHSCQ